MPCVSGKQQLGYAAGVDRVRPYNAAGCQMRLIAGSCTRRAQGLHRHLSACSGSSCVHKEPDCWVWHNVCTRLAQAFEHMQRQFMRAHKEQTAPSPARGVSHGWASIDCALCSKDAANFDSCMSLDCKESCMINDQESCMSLDCHLQ